MIKKLTYGMAAASFAALLSTTAANALLIDDFYEAPQDIKIVGPAPPVTTRTALDNDPNDDITAPAPPGAGPKLSIIGGYRDIATTLAIAPATRETHSEGAIVNGEFAHTQEVGVGSHTIVTWDGKVGGPDLNSADLTDGGLSDRFHIVITLADLAITWSLEVFDGNSSDIEYFSSLGGIFAPTAVYLPFTLFTGIDFTDINKIVFSANINDPSTVANEADRLNVDTAVCLIDTVGLGAPNPTNCSAVPEPASLTLLGAGIMGLGYFGKRRRKA